MVRFYRRRRYRYRPRKYVRRYFKRRMRRFVNGSSRSQVRVKCPVAAQLTLSSGTNQTGNSYSNPAGIAPYAGSSVVSVLQSPLYRQYCKLYDEVQCIGMKVRLAFTNQLGAALPSIRVHSCWDRRHGYGEPVPSVDEIKNSASYMPSQAVQNSVCKMQRSCYQSDLIEKIQWHDCSIEDPVSPGTVYKDSAFVAAGLNPNFFCPAFFYYVEEPGLDNYVALNVSLDVIYYFKFRNPRYGGAASGSSKMDTMDAPVTRAYAPEVDMDTGEEASLSAFNTMDAPTGYDPDDYHRAGLNQGGVRPDSRAGAISSAKRATMVDPPGPLTAGRSRPVFGGRGSLNVE